MKQYTKQITVQAVQWTGENLEEVRAFCEKFAKAKVALLPDTSLTIGLFQGAEIGDYITSNPTHFAVEAVKADDFTRDYKEVSE